MGPARLTAASLLIAAFLAPLAAPAITPVNTEVEFFAMLNYPAYPALAKVQAAVSASNYALAKEEYLTYMRNRTATGKYFFDAQRQRADLVRERGVSQTMINQATTDLLHVFTNYNETQNVGDDINWSQGSASFIAIFNRWYWNDAHGGSVDDTAWVYHHTQNETFAREVIDEFWVDWEEDNNMPTAIIEADGVPWSRLTTAFRSWNLMDTYFLILQSQSLTPQSHYLIMRCLAEHGRYLSQYCSALETNHAPNHQAAGATGLATIADCLPEFTESSTWRANAYARMADRMNITVTDEGWWNEYALGYCVNATMYYTRIFELAARNGIPYDRLQERRHRLMCDTFFKSRFPNGMVIGVGDTDPMDAYPGLATGQGVVRYGDAEWRTWGWRPSVADVGYDGLRIYDAMNTRTYPYTSVLYPVADFAIMRSDPINKTRANASDPNPFSQMAVLDFNRASAHSHQDIGQIMYFGYNQWLSPDSGTYNYGTAQYTTLTRAANHSVVLPGGAYVFGESSPRDITEFETTPGYDWAKGLASTTNLTSPVLTRQTLYVRPDYLLVVDKVNYAGNHRQYWQFAVGADLALDASTKELKTTFNAGFWFSRGLQHVLPLHPEEITAAAFEPTIRSTFGGGLGNSQRGWYQFTGNPAMRETVLLAQYPNSYNTWATLTAIDPAGKTRAQACGMELTMTTNTQITRDVILMNHEGVTTATTFGPYSTDAAMAYLRFKDSGAVSHIMIRNGKILTSSALTLVSSPETLQDLSVWFDVSAGTSLTISARPNTHTVAIYEPRPIAQVLYNSQPHSFSRNGDAVIVNMAHTATRLVVGPQGPYRDWMGSVNRLSVAAVDDQGFVDGAFMHSVNLSASPGAVVLSPDGFLTTGTATPLTNGEGSIHFRVDTPTTVAIQATYAGLATGVKNDITIRGLPSAAPPSGQAPYPGPTGHGAPGAIEAEDYDYGGQGEAYSDTTPGNAGGVYRTDQSVDLYAEPLAGNGYTIGDVAAGEWTEYTLLADQAAVCAITLRVAATTPAKTCSLSIDGQAIPGNLTVPNTGGWSNYVDVTRTDVALSQAPHVLRISTATGGYRLDRITIVRMIATSTPTPTLTPTPTRTPSPTPTRTPTRTPTPAVREVRDSWQRYP